jgi:hypothetical protein
VPQPTAVTEPQPVAITEPQPIAVTVPQPVTLTAPPPIAPIVIEPPADIVYTISDEILLKTEEGRAFKARLLNAMGTGPHTVNVKVGGRQYSLVGKALDHVPEEFLKQELVHA